MKAKAKIVVACIGAGAAVIAAIIGIVPSIINRNKDTTVDEVANMEDNSSIKIENSEIEFNGGDDSINTVFVGNDNINNQTVINNYYYLSNDSDNHSEDNSEKESTGGGEFYIQTKVRLVGHDDKTWHSSVYAEVGDIVQFQMQYVNISDETQFHVAVRDILPQNLKYVEGSTKLYNTLYPGGISIDQDNLVTNGILIGNYNAGANAYIRFRAEVISDTLTEGVNLCYNWGQAQADASDQIILQDDACVIVNYHID